MKRFIVSIFLKRLYYQRLAIVRGGILRLLLRGSHGEPKFRPLIENPRVAGQSQGRLGTISGDYHALLARNDKKPYFLSFLILLFPLFLFAQNNYVFGPSIRVNDDSPGTCDRACSQRSSACRGDTVFLTWSDVRFGNTLVFFSKSTDGANTWSPNVVISQNIPGDNCYGSHMCLDASGNIFVSYGCRDAGSNADIYFVKSTNGGSTFTTPVLVNDSSAVPQQIYPSCAVGSSGQYVYIAWQDWRNPQFDSDIYFARSTDGGASFLPSTRVNDDSILADQWYPVVACDNSGQNIYVAWADPRDSLHGRDVYFSRSTDYGQTFEVNYPVNDTGVSGNSIQRNPSIFWQNGIIYLAWDDLRQNCMGAYFDKSVDGGTTFGTDVFIVDTPNVGGAYPSIAVDDSSKIYVVWNDCRQFDPYGSDIYFSFSQDSGQTFKPNVLVNDHLGNLDAIDDNPSICVNESARVFVAWDSDRNDHQWGYEDIYCATGSYVGIMEEARSKMTEARIAAYPNPFRQTTTIKFQAPRTKNQIELKIYDVSGRLIRFLPINLCNQNKSVKSVCWYGDDQQGHQVPAGVYILELINNNRRLSQKVIKIGGVK